MKWMYLSQNIDIQMTIANEALRSIAKQDVSVNYRDWHESGYFFWLFIAPSNGKISKT